MSFKSIESISEEIRDLETKIEELGDMVPSKQAEFDESFDECFPMVEFGDLKYLASHVLKEVDPIAYREEYLNWVNSRVEELESELEDLKEELEELVEEQNECDEEMKEKFGLVLGVNFRDGVVEEIGCCDSWSSSVVDVNGKCPECGEPTVDGKAAKGCIHSPVSCNTCGHRGCDLSC